MNIEILQRELLLRTSRSSGSGGQNVNKVETKVELVLNIRNSAAFSEAEKTLIFDCWASKITADGNLSVTNQTERSQLSNRILAEKKLLRLLRKALQPPKARRQTTVSYNTLMKRGRNKRINSEKKANRRTIRLGD